MNNELEKRLLEKKVFSLTAENAKLKANQDYIAMMTDVELPEESEEQHEF